MLLTLLSPQGAPGVITAALVAVEAKDIASFTITAAAVAASLTAVEAQDIAAFVFTIPVAGQFTVSGPHVTDIFTTTTLSYPYDIKRRTA